MALKRLALSLLPSFVAAQSFPDPGNCTSVQNPPGNTEGPSYCGIQTMQSQQAITLAVLQADNLTSCRNVCLRRQSVSYYETGCCSFSFDSTNNNCYLYEDYVATSGGGDPYVGNSPDMMTFYDETCFTCPTLCPASSINALDNAGFENYPNAYGPWVNSQDQGGSIVSPGYESSQALNVSCRACRQRTNGIFQLFDSCPLTYYWLSFDYKIFPANNKSQPGMQVYANDLTYTSGTPPTSDPTFMIGTWTTFGDFLYADTTIYNGRLSQLLIAVSNGPGAGGDMLLDNASVKPYAGKIAAKQGAAQMVKNGEFANGTLEPWSATVLKDRGSAKVVRSGSSYVFQAKINPDVVFNPAVNLSQTISGLTPGGRYLLTYNFNTKQPARYEIILGPTTLLVLACVSQEPCNATVKTPVVVRQASTLLQFVIYGDNSNVTSTIDFGNIGLKLLA